jgi:hypothetical protein
VHHVGVSAPDIAGADESNPPASESFRSIVACFEMASGLIRPVRFYKSPLCFRTSERLPTQT